YDERHPWFWCDIETTGLDPYSSLILEIAVKVTDCDLNVLDSIHLVLYYPLHILVSRSSSWCKRAFASLAFGGNGLFDQCSQSSITFHEAEHRLAEFFGRHTSQMDGATVQNVSSMLEMARRWRPDLTPRLPPTANRHRACIDIDESIALMRFFKAELFTGMA
ncbi:unnamed protein product, partial [Phaeothamnion confervicola]